MSLSPYRYYIEKNNKLNKNTQKVAKITKNNVKLATFFLFYLDVYVS